MLIARERGFAAYKVADSVNTHEAWGMISACFFQADPNIHSARAFEVSVRPNVRLHDILTVSLGQGTIDHVVNDIGAATFMAHCPPTRCNATCLQPSKADINTRTSTTYATT